MQIKFMSRYLKLESANVPMPRNQTAFHTKNRQNPHQLQRIVYRFPRLQALYLIEINVRRSDRTHHATARKTARIPLSGPKEIILLNFDPNLFCIPRRQPASKLRRREEHHPLLSSEAINSPYPLHLTQSADSTCNLNSLNCSVQIIPFLPPPPPNPARADL